MNHKLYKKYLSLKIEDSSYFYLFQSREFYFFISDDAKIVAPLLDLKLTNLNSVIMKCGFSMNLAKQYLEKINQLKLEYQIIPLTDDIYNYDLEKCFHSQELNEMIENFINLRIDDFSISQAFDLLHDLQEKFKFSQEK